MHVPSDAFQGRSPEIAARDALGRLFTAVAARATLAETLEREGAESETYLALKAYDKLMADYVKRMLPKM